MIWARLDKKKSQVVKSFMHWGLPALIWIFSVALLFCFRERLSFLDHACQQTLNLKLVLTTCAEIYIRNVLKPNRIPSSVLWLTFRPLKAAVVIGSDSTFISASPASEWNVGEACGKLAENLRKITRKSDWTLVNWRQNWTNEIEGVLRYKTAQKAVKKVNKKVSGHT